MKKFFSAILLMTMMVFSVGTFVSCNDLVEEVETIKGQTSDIESTIKGLETQIAALETALKAEIKSAADQAKADAIAEAKAECEVLKAAFEQALAGKADVTALEELAALVNAEIAAIDEDLAKMATKVELEEAVKELVATDTELKVQIAALEAYKAYADTAFVTVEEAQKEAQAIRDELTKLAEENYNQLYELIGDNFGLIGNLIEDVDSLKLADASLAALIEANTSNLNSVTNSLMAAIDDLDILKGNVEGLEAGLEEVETKVATLEEKVEKIDADLNTLKTTVDNLVDRIQDVVLVPTPIIENQEVNFTEDIVVNGYKHGNFTTFRFLATYEVTPKYLVSKLADSDVDIYFSNVVAKAEPARYEAEIVDIDEETGRVTLRGAITDKNSAAYKYFADPTDDYAAYAVAVALHIDEPTVEGGSYVTTEYSELNRGTTTEVKDLVYLYDNEAGLVANPYTYARIEDYKKAINIPFTTPVENSARSFFPIDLLVLIEGQFYTLDQAAKFLGLESLAAEYTVSDFTANDLASNNKNADYIALSGKKTMDAAAQLKKKASKDQIGMQAKASITKIKVGGVETVLTVESTYKITEGKDAAIKFNDLNVTWSYKYSSKYDNTIPGGFDHYYLAANTPEVAVKSPVDITKLKVKDEYGEHAINDPEKPADVMLVPYSKTTGQPILNAAGTYYAATGTVSFHAISSNDVIIDQYKANDYEYFFTNIPFLDQDVAWVADFTLYDPDTKIEYAASFVVNTTAKASDKVIDLGTIYYPGASVKGVQIPVKAIDAIMAKDGALYADLNASGDLYTYKNNNVEKAYDFGTGAAGYIENGPTNSTGISLDFEKVGTKYYAYKMVDGNKVETSYINIPASASEYEKTYDLVWAYDLYGVQYTFKAKVELTKPTVYLEAHPMRVPADGVIDMKGDYKIPTYAAATDLVFEAYNLSDVNLRDYVNIVGEIVPGEYSIKYAIKTEYKKNNVAQTVANINDYSPSDMYSTDPYSVVKIENWNTDLNEVVVEVQLTSADGKAVKFGDPVTLTLRVPELINVTSAPVSADYNNASALTEASFVEGVVIKEALSGKNTDIFNSKATVIGDYFDYMYKPTSTQTWAGDQKYSELFNISFATVKKEDIKAKLTNGRELNNTDFNFNASTGVVSIDMNNSGITHDVIVTVPVTVKHNYQGVGDKAHKHEIEVEITFKKN